jgi:pimeloyl-ACP methyl ester carboxylesterase
LLIARTGIEVEKQSEVTTVKKLDIHKLGRALKNVLVVAAVIVAGIYLYLAPRLNRGITDRILFHPPVRTLDRPIEIGGITGKHYRILASNFNQSTSTVSLDSIFFKLPKDKEHGVILYSLGVGSSINTLCDPFQVATLLQLGYSVFIYDQEGYGLSSGKCDINRWVPDTTMAHDFLVNELKYPSGSVIAYGESFGAGVTSELSKQRSLKAMILESPFTSPKDWADQRLSVTAIYPDFLFMEPTFNNLAMLKGKHPPVLVIGTALDQNVPVSHARQLADQGAQPFQYLELPTSPHVYVSEKDRGLYQKQVKLFLAQFSEIKE